jgi:hypothetical protein
MNIFILSVELSMQNFVENPVICIPVAQAKVSVHICRRTQNWNHVSVFGTRCAIIVLNTGKITQSCPIATIANNRANI